MSEIYEYMAYYLSKNDEYLEKLRLKGKIKRVQQDPKEKMNEFERKLKVMSRIK